jgi:hypothetical protein
VALIIDQHFDPVAFGKALDEPFAVFECPADEIVGDPDVQRATGTTGENVNPQGRARNDYEQL